MPAINKVYELAFTHHRVVQVEPRKLDLPRLARRGHVVDDPVVKFPVVLELQGAQGVSDVLDGVGQAVGEVVHGVDTPGITCAVVGGVTDPVQKRVTHFHVGRRHVDLRPKDMFTVFEFACPHAAEKIQVLLNRAAAVGAVGPRLRHRSAVLANLIFVKAADIGLARFDQVNGEGVQLLEVIRCVKQVVAPIVTQPLHIPLYGLDVLHVLRLGVAVVETQMTASPRDLVGDAKVKRDALCMPDVKVTVGLRRKPRHDSVVLA